MDEYIKRDDALAAMSKHGITKNMRANKAVAALPAADVEPIVHAHWENVGGNDKVGYAYGTCSHCRQEAWANYELTSRCPYCGAHMDEEVK